MNTESSHEAPGPRKTTVHAVAMLLAGIGVSFGSGYPVSAQAAQVHTEKIEWTWSERSDTIDPKLPNVLLVGDSITRAYFPEVAKRLAGKANVYLFATSCSSGDRRLNAQLHRFFETTPAFRDSPSSRLIWASITPVLKDDPQGARNAASTPAIPRPSP